jgi:F-type H+-transporting ATPase subunit b
VVSLDFTILIQMINFLVLIFALNLLLYKPILRIMEKRKKLMQDTDDDIKHLNGTVEERVAIYEDKLRTAKLDALNLKNDILKEGADQAKRLIEAARSDIPSMMEQFNEKINKEISEAKRTLDSQSQKISVEIAEKLLERSLP